MLDGGILYTPVEVASPGEHPELHKCPERDAFCLFPRIQ